MNSTEFQPALSPWSTTLVRCQRVGVVLALLLPVGCNTEVAGPSASGPSSPQEQTVDIEAVRVSVADFCGDCHAVPPAESFPRSAWYAEVNRGFDFYKSSGRTDLKTPKMSEIVAYYRALAPAELTVAKHTSAAPATNLFVQSQIPLPSSVAVPAVSFLRFAGGADEGRGVLAICDMQAGQVGALEVTGRDLSNTQWRAAVAHPGHVEPTDLDGDGATDWVVADLGSFQPADHQRGQVVWVQPSESDNGCSMSVLADGLGRVADVQPGDFDSDGDLDLIVAEFGWLETGRIVLLERDGERDGIPEFKPRVIDTRHGAIHTPVVDLDGDGRLDFVALVSQEHEVVDAFMNNGDGTFEIRRIFDAKDPAYGSSGIQLVDLDADGDVDVLYTNGDTLDSFYLKPYHAVQWLENTGSFPFVPHQLHVMPGAMRAVAADMDGDDDLDVVACAHVPEALLGGGGQLYDSLVWLEQTSPGEFESHVLERSRRGHMALEVGDFDQDGRTDMAVGNFANRPLENEPWLTIWWGQSSGPGL